MFRKVYPYLQNNYYENVSIAQDKRSFLSKIDKFVNQKQYVKVTLLNWDEKPLKEIQGEISTGAITKDGASSVRRTATLTFSVNNGDYDIENSEMDFAINKKIYIEIGIKNYTDEYKEYPILWFPQGLFFIGGASVSSSTSSAVSISLSLKDKMCALNGDVGGVFPSTTVLDEVDTQLPNGEYISKKVPIYDIIVEVVNHFGNEDLNNIVIEDVDTRIKQVMQWRGSNPLYLIPNGATEESGEKSYQAQVNPPDENTECYVFEMGEDVGYIYSDFTWTGELTAAAGDTCVTILDQIKNALGNYEYFYDEYGVFHFREIKNYLNTSQGTSLLEDMNKNEYLVETTTGKSVYTFNDDQNIMSISCNPKYDNIKNDYIIHGTRKISDSDVSVDIMYHLAIDSKPVYSRTEEYGFFNFLIYKDETTDLNIGCFPQAVDELPEVGNFNIIYKNNDKFYYWTSDKVYKEVEVVKYYNRNSTNETQIENENYYMPYDWRTYLYVTGLRAKNLGTEQGYYFPELEAKWPGVYDIYKQEFYKEVRDYIPGTSSGEDDSEDDNPELQIVGTKLSEFTNGDYFLDFIEPATTSLGEFSIKNIGRRTDVVNDDDINCLFQPDILDVIFINIDDVLEQSETEQDKENALSELRTECRLNGDVFSQVTGDIYNALATGGSKNGAFDRVKYELYLHTNYQETVSITAIPVFYLEPNTRVTINDKSTNTYGDFVISNISMPLGAGSTMSVSCSQALERF